MSTKSDELTAPSEGEDNDISMVDMKKIMQIEVTDKGKKKIAVVDEHGNLWNGQRQGRS